MLIVNIIGNPKVFAYKTIRALAQIQLDLSTHDFQKLQTGSFKIKYQEIPEESARLVAETGKDIITPVNELLPVYTSGENSCNYLPFYGVFK